MPEAILNSGPVEYQVVLPSKPAPSVAATDAEIKSALMLPVDILTFPGTLADPKAEVEAEIG